MLGRWGKSLALRLPQELAGKADLHEGEVVELVASPEGIVIRRVKPSYDLARLFAGRSPEEWRALYTGAYDWGPDVGREQVEE